MNTKIRVKKNLITLLIILITAVFSSVFLSVPAVEASELDTSEITYTAIEETEEIATYTDADGNFHATATGDQSHDINDIYIVLLLIMITLFFWMSVDILVKMVRIFLK